MAATTFARNLFTGSGGSGFLYPESIGKVNKTQEGEVLEERGVYTFNIGNSGNSDNVHYLRSGETLICPLMDYEFTTDMMMWFMRVGATAITDTSVELGWYGQNDESIISAKWKTLDADGITTTDPNPNVTIWGNPRLIDYDAFNEDLSASSMQARHTAIGIRCAANQVAGTTILKVKIVPYRA